jgi:hypothetical protein
MVVILKNISNLAGLSVEIKPPVNAPKIGSGDPMPRSWISDELVEETRIVWARAYGRDVSDDEAMEILMNVKRLAEALLRIQRSK